MGEISPSANGESGTRPTITKEKKVIAAVLRGSFRVSGRSTTSRDSDCSDFSAKKFDEAMENPSAKTLASPSTRIIAGDKPAPITPDTIANVVTVPSMAPYTNSAKYFSEYALN